MPDRLRLHRPSRRALVPIDHLWTWNDTNTRAHDIATAAEIEIPGLAMIISHLFAGFFANAATAGDVPDRAVVFPGINALWGNEQTGQEKMYKSD